MNTEEMVHFIADKLGFDVSYHQMYGLIWEIDEQSISLEKLDRSTLFMFIAFAKAEMIKRGHKVRSGFDVMMEGPERYSVGCRLFQSIFVDDPTDPMSVAEAELKAICEVLK